MFVCVHVCVCVHTYVCMLSVCMYECMGVCVAMCERGQVLVWLCGCARE